VCVRVFVYVCPVNTGKHASDSAATAMRRIYTLDIKAVKLDSPNRQQINHHGLWRSLGRRRWPNDGWC